MTAAVGAMVASVTIRQPQPQIQCFASSHIFTDWVSRV